MKKQTSKVSIPYVEVPRDDQGYTQSFSIEQLQDAEQFFDEFGFVVIRDVLTNEECASTLNEIFGIIESEGTFKRNDLNTWSNWPQGSIEQYGSPHKPPVFLPQFLQNRQNPKVYRVFAHLLRNEDLMVNHDRCCLFRPTTGVPVDGIIKNFPQWSTKPNVHIDMNPWAWLGDGAECRKALARLRYNALNNFIFENNQPSHSDGRQLQGVLNLCTNQEEDGGFWCIPGFFHHFDEYFGSLPADLESPSYSFGWKDPLMKMATRVPMRAGSMVVWDQRMPHGSDSNRSSRFRAAQFIKMFPRSTVNEQRGRARAVVINDILFKLRNNFQLTELGLKLFGLDVLKASQLSVEVIKN